MEECESDNIVEKWIQEHDKSYMPLPSFESEPHLLISKVIFLQFNLQKLLGTDILMNK